MIGGDGKAGFSAPTAGLGSRARMPRRMADLDTSIKVFMVFTFSEKAGSRARCLEFGMVHLRVTLAAESPATKRRGVSLDSSTV
jgi:hypothetical protein